MFTKEINAKYQSFLDDYRVIRDTGACVGYAYCRYCDKKVSMIGSSCFCSISSCCPQCNNQIFDFNFPEFKLTTQQLPIGIRMPVITSNENYIEYYI